MNPDQLSSSPIHSPDDQFAVPTDYSSITAAVVEITKSLFGDQVTAVEEWDPEIAGCWYIMLYVGSTKLSNEEILGRQNQWYQRVREAAKEAHGHYSILVDTR